MLLPRGEAFALICGQAGDGQGPVAELDGAGGAGLFGGGDDLLEGDGAGELSVGVAGGGDLPSVHGEGLGGVWGTWLRQGGVECMVFLGQGESFFP